MKRGGAMGDERGAGWREPDFENSEVPTPILETYIYTLNAKETCILVQLLIVQVDYHTSTNKLDDYLSNTPNKLT